MSPDDVRLNHALVRYDKTGLQTKAVFERIISKGLRSVNPLPSDNNSYAPNYIAVYWCADLDAVSTTGRLFFQVELPDQTKDASAAALRVKTVLPGLTVIREIEIVGNKAPGKSELRYFYKGDAELANRAAAAISAGTSSTVAPKLVAGYEAKVRPGTLEAWISKQDTCFDGTTELNGCMAGTSQPASHP